MVLIGSASAIVALVGRPLCGDGSYYFVRITLTGEALVQVSRVSAVPAQVPVLALRRDRRAPWTIQGP